MVAANDDLRAADWEKIYEFLFGGFEDIGTEDSEEEEEDEGDDVPKTKDGYVKDGFIVDDSDDTEEQEDDDETLDDDDSNNDSTSDDHDDYIDEPLPPVKPVVVTKNKNQGIQCLIKLNPP